jgi:hypothetical protein
MGGVTIDTFLVECTTPLYVKMKGIFISNAEISMCNFLKPYFRKSSALGQSFFYPYSCMKQGTLNDYGGGLGSTGGVLMASLIIGHCLSEIKHPLNMSKETLSSIRDLSLNMFLAIVVLKYGYTTVNSILQDGMIFLAAAVVSGSVALIVGILVGRLLMKMNWIVLSGAI